MTVNHDAQGAGHGTARPDAKLGDLLAASLADPANRPFLVGAATCLALFALLFRDSLWHLYYAWTTDDNYSHGFLVPFISNRGERAPSRRPVAVLLVIVIYTTLGILTYEGVAAPWSPVMSAWSGDPVPTNLVEGRTPLELQGVAVFQYKNCRNCHALEGIGGRGGPDLTTVGDRLTRARKQLRDLVVA